MPALGEQTPLLRRVGIIPDDPSLRRNNKTEQHGDHNGGVGDDVESTQLGSKNAGSGYEPIILNDKEDRRAWGVIRWVLRLGEEWQQFTIRLVPPMDTEDCYEDLHNDEPWSCRCGTREDDGTWLNNTDRAGCLMAMMVWVLILYSALTMVLLAQDRHMSPWIAALHCTICALALMAHAKTQLTDPGAIPSSAVPPPPQPNRRKQNTYAPELPPTMCSLCQAYKPVRAHHCRICNRCISRMDHHCPWMNNCVGVANFKHFILFLAYTWTGCSLALIVFGVNYFACADARCEFNVLEIQLVRAMTLICFGTLAFTTSMLMNVIYGIVTGIGTIDRLKLKASDTWQHAADEPTPLSEIFGVAPVWTWFLPLDPIFDNYDHVVGYATRQRLLRQQAAAAQQQQQQHGDEGQQQSVRYRFSN